MACIARYIYNIMLITLSSFKNGHWYSGSYSSKQLYSSASLDTSRQVNFVLSASKRERVDLPTPGVPTSKYTEHIEVNIREAAKVHVGSKRWIYKSNITCYQDVRHHSFCISHRNVEYLIMFTHKTRTIAYFLVITCNVLAIRVHKIHIEWRNATSKHVTVLSL